MRRILKNIEPIFHPNISIIKDFIEFDELEEYALYWHTNYNKLTSKPFNGSLKVYHTSHIQIVDAIYSTDILIDGENPDNSVVLVIPRTDNSTIWMGEELKDDEVMIIQNKDSIDFQTIKDCNVVLASINKELLEKYWQIYYDQPFEDEIKSGSKIKLTEARSKYMLANSWDNLLNIGLNLDDKSYTDTFESSFDQDLIDNLVRSFESVENEIPPNKSNRIAKLARDYLLDNINEPISIYDLCLITKSNKRTLHHSFKSLYDYSPAQFIKRLRLNNSRRQLLNASKGTTVTDIAFKWKFFHLSRFARDYYIMFGEYPSETLKRSNSF